MSEITISQMIFSIILFRLGRLDIGLSISIDSGGYCLGIGVMVSFLYIFGHWPTDRPVLMMFAIGIQIEKANSLIIFAGISPGAVDLFVFIFWRYFLYKCMKSEIDKSIKKSDYFTCPPPPQ